MKKTNALEDNIGRVVELKFHVDKSQVKTHERKQQRRIHKTSQNWQAGSCT